MRLILEKICALSVFLGLMKLGSNPRLLFPIYLLFGSDSLVLMWLWDGLTWGVKVFDV